MGGLPKYRNKARMYFYVKYQSTSSSIIEQSTDLSRITSLKSIPTFPFFIHSQDVPRLPFSVTTLPYGNIERSKSYSPSTWEAATTSNRSTADARTEPKTLRDGNLKTKKKYKPVAQKVRGILGEMPEKFRIIR